MEQTEKVNQENPEVEKKNEDVLFWISDWHFGNLQFTKSQMKEFNLQHAYPKFKDQGHTLKQIYTGDIVRQNAED